MTNEFKGDVAETTNNIICGSASLTSPANSVGGVWTYPYNGGPQLTSGVTYSYTPLLPSKVALSLSEIEALRKAAKGDAKVKAALKKMAHLIEIAVDFD